MIRIRVLIATAAVLALHSLTAGVAAGQVGGFRPATRPTTSPYLNLLRNNGGIPAVNYYGLVRPELQMRNNLQDLQQQVTANRQAVNGLSTDQGLPGTGVVGSFLNTGGYFMNMNAAGMSGGTSGVRAGTGRVSGVGAPRSSAAGRFAPPRR